jgi:RNA recognition motif-containing protein
MTSVYIGNLSWDLDHDGVYDAVSQIAEPTNVDLKMNKYGKSLGYAIVTFASPEDAQEVIAQLHGANLEGREVNCREDRGARPKKERAPRQPQQQQQQQQQQQEAPVASNRVYIGNLSWNTTDDILLDALAPFNVVSARVQLQSSGASKGWAIAEFGSVNDAQEAIDTLNGQELDGRDIVVREDCPRNAARAPRQPRQRRERRVLEEGAPSQSVFIGNLSWDMNDEALSELLNGFGVEESSVNLRPDGKSRGFAIARFDSVEEAQRAIDELNGQEVMGRNLLLKFDAKQ